MPIPDSGLGRGEAGDASPTAATLVLPVGRRPLVAVAVLRADAPVPGVRHDLEAVPARDPDAGDDGAALRVVHRQGQRRVRDAPTPPGRNRDDMDVQRLRYVKQLGTMYLVYPCALHTRFDHSVGVAHLAGILHKSLEDKIKQAPDGERPELNDVTMAALQLAALLHDIGHGPFGHIFEEYCHRSGHSEWSHESVSQKIITGEIGPIAHERTIVTNTREIPEFLARVRAALGADKEFGQLLSPQNIYRIGKGLPIEASSATFAKKYRFLSDVVPIGFGVDRMDYLRRDAYFTGIATGNIDLWELIQAATLHKDGEEWRLKLDSSAALAYETLLQVRSFTFRRLYNNPLNRAADELVVRGLVELSKGEAPQRLALLNDHQLLEEFYQARKDKPVLGDIYRRLMTRRLPETIPLALKGNLPDKARLTLDEHKALPVLAELEADIGKDVGLQPPLRLFFHFQEVKAVVFEDFAAKHLVDPVTGEMSLFELGDHLRELYDGPIPGGRAKHEVYNQKVSPVYVSFPFEGVSELLKESLSAASWDIDEAVESCYQKFVTRLLEDFTTKILQLKNKDLGDMKKSLKPTEKRFRAYLHALAVRMADEQAL